MNNYIIISRTYAETTPESSEIGDFSDHGFVTEEHETLHRRVIIAYCFLCIHLLRLNSLTARFNSGLDKYKPGSFDLPGFCIYKKHLQ